MRAIPGIIDVITKLKDLGYRIIVITNGFRNIQMEKIQKCRIESLIDDFITSEEVGEGKPNPKIFLEALNRYNTPIEDAWVIGDAWDLDILGASQLGIGSIWLNRRHQKCPNPEMTKEIFDVSEILAII
jgi:putative hydrolase of the HAD superfamily